MAERKSLAEFIGRAGDGKVDRRVERPDGGLDRRVVSAVLRWLRDMLAWCSEDPESRLPALAEELVRNYRLVERALSETVLPEFSEYRDLVVSCIARIVGRG